MKSLQGHLLVAAAELRDPNFFHSVVLIFRHDDDGAAGLILNRRTQATIQQVWRQVSESACHSRAPLCLGGPVDGPLMALHAQPPLAEIDVMPGVYVAASQENLEQLVIQDDETARFFVGYAGWGSGQLERELEESAWLTVPANADHVFGDQDRLWEQATKDIKSSALLSALKIKHVPKEPWLN
jgi:putative transcriptional regulator